MARSKKTVGRVILIVIGGFFLLAFVLGLLSDSTGNRELLRNAVWLDSPTVLPENEGKTVVIRGKLAGDDVTDPKSGITFDSPIVLCLVEKYNYNYIRYSSHWDWEYNDKIRLASTVRIGEFILDAPLTEHIPMTESPDDLQAHLPVGYFVTEVDGTCFVSDRNIQGIGYTKSHEQGTAYVGTLRMCYTVPPSDEIYTVIGVQRDGKLCFDASLGDTSVQVGEAVAEDFLKDIREDETVFNIVCISIAVLCLFFGFKGILYWKET